MAQPATNGLSSRKLTINCDMGEGFGKWKMGPDAELMPLIDLANVACGFHGGDPSVMAETVRLAKKHSVLVGAHPGLPDLLGFGRRAMAVDPVDLRALVLYQVAALVGVLKDEGMALNHIKPHGKLYLMTSDDVELCRAVYSVAKLYDVPVLGLKGSMHEKVANELGVAFIPEFFPDVNYDGEGKLTIVGTGGNVSPDIIPNKVKQSVVEDTVTTMEGTTVSIGAGEGDLTFCVHSDIPGCIESTSAVRRGIEMALETCH